MQRSWMWVVVTAGILVSARVEAQGALQGPLAAPDAPVIAPAHKKTRPKTRAAAKHVPAQEATDKMPQVLTETSSKQAPGDPVSFGMKWNGSNDNAEQTRVQNYNGGAQGTGAEVGMKLHF